MNETRTETLEFRSELRQVLHLITHSLYSHREVFLRELISNASDAIDKVRFAALADEGLLEGNHDFQIRLLPDVAAGTLTVSDNGIGMTRDEAVDNLGTIAKSGTRAFLERLTETDPAKRPGLIGQFGVGFYSAFMVADRVTVVTRAAGATTGVRWESDGQGTFTVEEAERPARGTDVVLHLKDDEKEFLKEWRLHQLVKQFSDFVEHPIVMDVQREEKGPDGKSETKVVTETLNSQKALWLRSKSGVTKEEYESFYRLVSNDFGEVARTIHYAAEGTTEFNVLLFVPGRMPMALRWGEAKIGPRLYVKRVLVMDHCEALLPPWLRFVSGVVDCPDLPLNVSRETVQRNPILDRVRKNIVKAILKALEELKRDEAEIYAGFFRELGPVLKEGVARDAEHREALADLLLIESVKTEDGKRTTLADYVTAMPEEQKEIWTLSGESRAQLLGSPVLEAFRAKGWDVLLLTDPVDEFAFSALDKYKEKPVRAADKGGLPDAVGAEPPAEEAARFVPLFAALAARISDVKEVRLSRRLTESASCLVAEEGEMGANLERLLRNAGAGAEVKESKRILELNGSHPAVEAVRALFEKSPDDPRVESYGRLLFEEAVLAEGSKLKDPAGFAKRVNELLVKGASGPA
jgi:molecular chaperone HtpG